MLQIKKFFLNLVKQRSMLGFISGLITSTALTLLVLPVLYRWFEDKEVEA